MKDVINLKLMTLGDAGVGKSTLARAPDSERFLQAGPGQTGVSCDLSWLCHKHPTSKPHKKNPSTKSLKHSETFPPLNPQPPKNPIL